MKCGTSCSIWTYIYLHRMRDQLKGRLTLTVVSDEETFGPWGTRYLMEHHADEVLGDCCLNGEPSGPETIRFGERGLLWLAITVKTRGAHGAYVAPHGQREPHRRANRHRPGHAGGDRGADLAGADAADGSRRGSRSTARWARVPPTSSAASPSTSGVMEAGLKVNMIPERVPARDRYPPAARRRARTRYGARSRRSSHAIRRRRSTRSTTPPATGATRTAPWSGSCRTTSST